MHNSDFSSLIKNLIPQDKPLVVYSAIWPLLRVFDYPPKELAHFIIDTLLSHNSNIIMPSFIRGFINGLADLNIEKSVTGYISEIFRSEYETTRTVSAFFPFNVIGEYKEELGTLRPKNAWGSHSLYHWLELNDAYALMLGTEPTHCSYLHRVEWLNRDLICYRHIKEFKGTILYREKKESLTERLYVRCRNPVLINDFTVLTQPFIKHGMSFCLFEGIQVSCMSIREMRHIYEPLLRADPLFTVKNKEDYNYANKTPCQGNC